MSKENWPNWVVRLSETLKYSRDIQWDVSMQICNSGGKFELEKVTGILGADETPQGKGAELEGDRHTLQPGEHQQM